MPVVAAYGEAVKGVIAVPPVGIDDRVGVGEDDDLAAASAGCERATRPGREGGFDGHACVVDTLKLLIWPVQERYPRRPGEKRCLGGTFTASIRRPTVHVLTWRRPSRRHLLPIRAGRQLRLLRRAKSPGERQVLNR